MVLDLKHIGRLLAISIQLFIHLLGNNFACHVNKNIMNYEHTVGMYSFNECCKFHVKLSFPFDSCFFELLLHDSWFIVMNKDKHLLCKKLPYPALQTFN